jgi:hypothetical protein
LVLVDNWQVQPLVSIISRKDSTYQESKKHRQDKEIEQLTGALEPDASVLPGNG